jgi:protein-S-isoprenylcysteine O-methyltransferase Ste14
MVNQAAVAANDHSEPVVFPPVIPLSGFLLGVLLEMVWPLARFVDVARRADLRGRGAALFGIGAAGFAWMVITMRRARTPIHNAKTPTVLIESGPFRFTRNPMYLFGSIAYAGLALFTVELWSLLLLPLVVIATHYGAVIPEERYLERKFGHGYQRYRQRVRRWL